MISTRPTRLLSVCLLVLIIRLAAPAAEEYSTLPGDRALFTQAESLLASGQEERALELLRTLRVDFSASPLADDALWLSARIYLAQEEYYRARFFLKKLVSESLRQDLVQEAAFQLGEVLYQDKIWDQADSYFRLGLRLAAKNGTGTTPQISRVYLRLSQLAYYQSKDIDLARSYLGRINTLLLAPEDRRGFNLLAQKLIWQYLRPGELGLEDGNISAITVDGDDLWIGTWSGGLARFSYSTGKIRVFQEGRNTIADNAIRAIAIGPKRVWVGTFEGLSVYIKPTDTWQQIEKFGSQRPGTISCIKLIDADVYAGTLGSGLWRLRGEEWTRVGNRENPGEYVLCLEEDRQKVYIGTMTKGVFVLDKKNGSLVNFDQLQPGLEPRNITMLLSDSQEKLWIGTYGEGLVCWDKAAALLTRFTRQSGEIKDDWVLCGQETVRGLYFGTFGGGVAHYSPASGSWSVLALEEGLGSLDIASLAYVDPLVYFGTLGAGISIYRETLHD